MSQLLTRHPNNKSIKTSTVADAVWVFKLQPGFGGLFFKGPPSEGASARKFSQGHRFRVRLNDPQAEIHAMLVSPKGQQDYFTVGCCCCCSRVGHKFLGGKKWLNS